MAQTQQSQTDGIILDLPTDQYFSSDALSKSDLASLAVNPELYRYRKTHSSIPTPAMKAGTAVHMAVLEPELFHETYLPGLAVDKRTKAYKQFVAENPDKIILPQEEYAKYRAICGSVMTNPTAKQLLQGEGDNEVSAFWRDDAMGIRGRCRADRLTSGLVIDLKTTKSASPAAFSRSCNNFKYHWQAWWYTHGMHVLTGDVYEFLFICVETDPPYQVAFYTLDDAALRLAEDSIWAVITRYLECQRKNQWPGFPPEIQTLALPRYAYNQEALTSE